MLPTSAVTPNTIFQNEAALCDYLHELDGFWKRIGCEKPDGWRTHTTPDFVCKLHRSRTNERMGVEVEMAPRFFDQHGHDSFNVHLLVVLYTGWYYRYHKGIPIISLYRKDPLSIRYLWSLDDDIGLLFHGRKSKLFEDAEYDRENEAIDSCNDEDTQET